MPVVEKVKKPPAEDSVTEVPEDIAIEKPKQRKQPTEAMKEAGRQNLAKGRLALQEKRKAASAAKSPAVVKQENPVPVPVPVPVVEEPVPPPHTPARPRSKKILYQEESDSDDEVIIVKKKKKKPTKKIIYEDESEDEPTVVRKKSIPAVERPASPPRYAQPSAVIRWI